MKKYLGEGLAKMIRQQRLLNRLTLHELSVRSGVSASHLVRVEKGERSPSARILKKIAEPLGFRDNELMELAGYLSNHTSGEPSVLYKGLDPLLFKALSEEPIEVQRLMLHILRIIQKLRRTEKGA